MAKPKRRPEGEQHDYNHDPTRPRKKTKANTSSTTAIQSYPPLPPITSHFESQVFTHRSAINDYNASKHDKCYERLEFLGDAYIELFASKAIYPNFPAYSAGRLSQLRELLVKNETIAAYAMHYGFDKRLEMSTETSDKLQREEKQRIKIMGDVFEAYVAAIVESEPELGEQKAERWLRALWKERLESTETEVVDLGSKNELSKRIGGRGVKVEYVEDAPVKRARGTETYTMAVYVDGWGFVREKLGVGRGLTKNEAGALAAAEALKGVTVQKMAGMKKVFDQATREKREQEGGKQRDVEPATT